MSYCGKIWDETTIERSKAKEVSQRLYIFNLEVNKGADLFWVGPDSILIDDVT